MFDIYHIIYKRRSEFLLLDILNHEFSFMDQTLKLNEKIISNYLRKLFLIIDRWQAKYVRTDILDGDSWEFSIHYKDGSFTTYSGHSSFPVNFEAFERLNQILIHEVLS